MVLDFFRQVWYNIYVIEEGHLPNQKGISIWL
jgi:hypothetical protein